MAGDSSITCMTLLIFSLLLAFHFSMAVPERSLSTLASIEDGAKKRNTTAAASAREGNKQNPKTETTPNQTANDSHVSVLLKGSKGGSSRAPRPPFQWQNRIFNASKHEVPSGPNPISNRDEERRKMDAAAARRSEHSSFFLCRFTFRLLGTMMYA
ncbi:hypothetical protein Fmac_008061 [Flemingia macrophylla]|uniref:Uncharacterized protein n=1 Tax=Flemingia macrophylla TaxID=520843 RepID=A0ABD1MWC3_9FABA